MKVTGYISRFLLVFVLISGWLFSGWPQIYNFPPEVQKVQAGSQTYTTAGTGTLSVPAGVTTITVKVWGAGGGGGGSGDSTSQDGGGGGGGGFAQGDVTVSGPETLDVYIGGGGALGTATGGSVDTGEGAGGGGYSGVARSGTFLIQVGGGGGGGGGGSSTSDQGGGGGGGSGANGANGTVGLGGTGEGDFGDGATTGAIGAGGTLGGTGADGVSGSGNTGGTGGAGGGGLGGTNGGGRGGGPETAALSGGGGGGGGAFGAGGGENSQGTAGGAGGGGGGSGKTSGLANVTTAAGTTGASAGTAGAAAQQGDADWLTPAGNGGAGGQSASVSGANGNPGRVVISWTDPVVDTPGYDNGTATYNNDVSVTITVASPASSTICYTTDGSTPGASTPGTCNASPTQTYSTPVAITATGTVLKAIGTKSGYSNSAEQSATYTLTVGAITSSPGAGTYTSTQSVTLSIATTTSAVAHYTIDGGAVSCASTAYSGAFNVAVTTTVKAIGCKTNYVSDTAISDLYTIGLSTAIEIRAQNYTTSVSSITFPVGASGATVSAPYNNIDTVTAPQVFGGAGTAKPVVTLYNGGASTLTIWYNITTFTNSVVSSENYLVNAKGAACADASCITSAVTFGADTTTGTTIAVGAGNEKDFYLKITLGSPAAKTGNSTLTILGEGL